MNNLSRRAGGRCWVRPCISVAGDGVRILAGAVIASVIALAGSVELALEYLLGFAFGWTIIQALFMRDMAGGN